MMEQFEHDAHRDRMAQVGTTPKVPNRLSERDKVIRDEWDAGRDAELWDGRSSVRGLLVGLLLMACMAFGIYKVIQWYVNTMPPHAFIGLHKDAR